MAGRWGRHVLPGPAQVQPPAVPEQVTSRCSTPRCSPPYRYKIRCKCSCDLFLAVGTSGTVSPASNFVRSAEYAGARTVYVNLEPMSPPNPAFQETQLGPAEVVLPQLLGVSS